MPDQSIDGLTQAASIGEADYFYVLQITNDKWCTAAQIVAAVTTIPNNQNPASFTLLSNYSLVYVRKLSLAAGVKLSLGTDSIVRIL